METTEKEKTTEREPYIAVTHGLRGWFAVYLVWNPEYGGFYEPECTGFGSYATPDEAADDARAWAQAEGIGCSHYGPVQLGGLDCSLDPLS